MRSLGSLGLLCPKDAFSALGAVGHRGKRLASWRAAVRGHSAAEAALGLLASHVLSPEGRALSSASAGILYNNPSRDARSSITAHRSSRNAGRSTSATRRCPNAAPLDTARAACLSGELHGSTHSCPGASFSG